MCSYKMVLVHEMGQLNYFEWNPSDHFLIHNHYYIGLHNPNYFYSLYIY